MSKPKVSAPKASLRRALAIAFEIKFDSIAINLILLILLLSGVRAVTAIKTYRKVCLYPIRAWQGNLPGFFLGDRTL
jgi:hypothetical protein